MNRVGQQDIFEVGGVLGVENAFDGGGVFKVFDVDVEVDRSEQYHPGNLVVSVEVVVDPLSELRNGVPCAAMFGVGKTLEKVGQVDQGGDFFLVVCVFQVFVSFSFSSLRLLSLGVC